MAETETAGTAEADDSAEADSTAEADGMTSEVGTAGGDAARGSAPYRAEAARDGGKWHLVVESLDNHPDRGEVDALVITVTPRHADDGFPADDLDSTLGQCGFARDGDWTQEGDRWKVSCRQPDPRAAPPAPPIPDEPGSDGAGGADPGASPPRDR